MNTNQWTLLIYSQWPFQRPTISLATPLFYPRRRWRHLGPKRRGFGWVSRKPPHGLLTSAMLQVRWNLTLSIFISFLSGCSECSFQCNTVDVAHLVNDSWTGTADSLHPRLPHYSWMVFSWWISPCLVCLVHTPYMGNWESTRNEQWKSMSILRVRDFFGLLWQGIGPWSFHSVQPPRPALLHIQEVH